MALTQLCILSQNEADVASYESPFLNKIMLLQWSTLG